MEWIFQPLATSSYLVAVANIVALATAGYFALKGLRWLLKFMISVYHNRVREFFRNQREWSERVADTCASNASYFMAHILARAVIITTGVLIIITNTVRMNAIATDTRQAASAIEGLPIWAEGNSEYNFYSISTIFIFIVVIMYLNALINLSSRVRKKIRAQISDRKRDDIRP